MIAIDLNPKNIPVPENHGQRKTISEQDSGQARGMIDHLKDEFGDYSDPLTYDWTWRETD